MIGNGQDRERADLADTGVITMGGVRVTQAAEAAGLGGGTGLRRETKERLRAAGLDTREVARVVRAALDEDFSYGPDVTSAATVAGRTVVADVVAREAGMLAGVLTGGARRARPDRGLPGWPRAAPPRRTATVLVAADGARIGAGEGVVLRVSGPAPAVLGAERTLLNFVTHLSGIATATRAWADAIAGTGAAVRDTRKTTPGLRALEKYAVRGAAAGRTTGWDWGTRRWSRTIHIRSGGRGAAAAVGAVHSATRSPGARPAVRSAGTGHVIDSAGTGLVVEVECDSVAQVREALDAGARFLLLDNTCQSARCGRRSRVAPQAYATGCDWRRAAASRSDARGRSRSPAWTTCRWGR